MTCAEEVMNTEKKPYEPPAILRAELTPAELAELRTEYGLACAAMADALCLDFIGRKEGEKRE